MTPPDRPCIPALHYGCLTGLFDPVMQGIMHDTRVKRRLLARAAIRAGECILDLGCGTGTLLILLKQAVPTADLIGVDADPRILAIARRKSARADVAITWVQAWAQALPFSAQTFDRGFATLLFHHLAPDAKVQAAREAWRVLRVGGVLHVVEFGPPHSLPMRLVAGVMRHVEETAAHLAGQFPEVLRHAGFTDVREEDAYATLCGPLSVYRARKANA